MKFSVISLTAAALMFAASHLATAQSYVPTPPIAKPNVLPKPVAGRPIKREQTVKADRSDN